MTAWTSARTDLLRKLWADGVSASQIAAELGEISRNSVIGKVHRLGLAARRIVTTVAPTTKRKRKRKPKPSRIAAALFSGYRDGHQLPVPREQPAVTPSPDQAAVMIVPEQPARCTIMDLDNAFSKCRWPEGDPRDPDFFYCGGKTPEGLSYCGYHSRIAYRPAESGRRRAG